MKKSLQRLGKMAANLGCRVSTVDEANYLIFPHSTLYKYLFEILCNEFVAMETNDLFRLRL